MPPEFHGTEIESKALLDALSHHCSCTYDEAQLKRTSTCSAHMMLLGDQRALDGLLFGRRSVEKLEAEEWMRPE
jgi:hypothetical protein